MRFAELIVLLPCHSLEDFPTYYEGEEADNLLAAWTGLWHPALLHSAQAVPIWSRVDTPPYTLGERLIVVPSVCLDRLTPDFAERVATEGGLLLQKFKDRDELITQALETLGDGIGSSIDTELVADFLALGFCRLQTELLTRQMRYSSNLDEGHFRREAVAAADAAISGDLENCRSHLRQCFDALDEARKYFYPVDSFLVDLTLTAESTLGEPLSKLLAGPLPVNVLLSGELLERMNTEHPETVSVLRQSLESGIGCVVGGNQHEGRLPFSPLEVVREDFAAGLSTFERILGRKPTVFGRRRYGLSQVLPQLLSKLGFNGALHFTLDDGHFPLDSQSKTRWESADGGAVDALMRLPRDAAKPESFLDFARRMGESMDRDHVATMVFAHWPGQTSCWYEDLRRACTYTQALGKFVTLDEYFNNTATSGRLSRFNADDYRAPYLKQAIIRREANPLCSIREIHRKQWNQYACDAARTLAAIASGHETLGIDSDAHPSYGAVSAEFAKAVCVESPSGSASEPGALLIANPLSFGRRMCVDVSALPTLPALSEQVLAVGEAEGKKHAIVEVPAFGFVNVVPGTYKPPRKAPKPIVDANVLRNDQLEVTVNPRTGGIQSLRSFDHRGNRLSQQLGMRLPTPLPKPGERWRDPDEDPNYADAVCEAVEITHSSSVLGVIATRGAMIDLEGKRLADFRQSIELALGSRVVKLSIELQIHEECRADPWNSYYASRFAWNDATADLYRGVALGREETKAKRIEAPEYIDIQSAKQRTSILTGGLPYHRRVGMRMLDTLLAVRGEESRTFEMAIALDAANPAAASAEQMTPPIIATVAGRPVSPTGWLLHVDAKNVLATHVSPVLDLSRACVGFQARLLETMGKAGRVRLTSARPLASAVQLDLLGNRLLPLNVEADKIVMDVAAQEWVAIEARFA